MQKSLVGQKIGNYELVSLRGKGGMGEVYVGLHPVLNRKVAVKVLSRALSDDEELVARFRQEAQAAGRIGHEAIVEVTDFGVLADDRCYYVMQLLHGMSLQEYLDEHGVVTVAEAVAILRPVLEALAAAHAAGIVHRDIKPDNIFLHRDKTGQLKPKLLDFGIAKLVDPTQSTSGVATRTGQLLGTPLYMSPEQAAGETQNIGPWSDVYSVAAVLFRMLTGKPPYEAKSFGALLLKHMQEPPPSLSTVRPELPKVLDGLIHGGMAKTPDARHQTVRSFLDELLADIPEGEQVPEALTLPIPEDSAQVATDPTMRADSSQAMSPTALASTTPADLIADKAQTTAAEEVSATGRTSLSSAAAQQLKSQIENEQGNRRILLIGGVVAGLLVLGSLLFWLLGGLERKRASAPRTAGNAAPMARPVPPTMRATPPRPKRPTVPVGWVRILKPAKPVRLGVAKAEPDEPYFRHQAGRDCCGQSFDIQAHEVTWGAYEAWARGKPQQTVKPPAHIPAQAAARKNLPVVNVGWAQALAYCNSLGGTLPSESQYEYAARGPTLALNPWGKSPVDLLRTALLVGKSPRLRPVCAGDQDVIRYGGRKLCDLAANALEWSLGPYLHPISPMKPPTGFPFGGLNSRHWRAVRGLPLLLEKDRVPRAASLYRAPGCISPRSCRDADRKKQLQYTGFRCVRPVSAQ